MTQPKQDQKNLLKSVDTVPAFSVQNVWVPEFRLPERVVGPGGFTVPCLDFLPFAIEFPCQRNLDTGLFEQDNPFMRRADEALDLERRIVSCIVASKNEMETASAEKFQAALVDCPTVQNILRRITGLRENKQQMVPGVYLGSHRADSGLGDVLKGQLSASYRHAGRAFPVELDAHCSQWGQVQSKARSEIIEATWSQIVNRGNWAVPCIFEDKMGCLLEGEIPERASEAWAEWLHCIEDLSESAGDPVLEGCKTVREWRSENKDRTEDQNAELRDNLLDLGRQFPNWGALLKNPKFLHSPSSINTDSLVTELFAVAKLPEAQPFHVDFLNGAPHRLVISEQQALDWGSLYLAHCDPREVTIRYSSDPSDSAWRSLRRTPEVKALMNSPMAEFITRLEFDCFGLSFDGCRDLFEAQLKFLKAYETNESWRNTRYDRTIEVLFTNASNRGPQDSLATLRQCYNDVRSQIEDEGLFEWWYALDEEVKTGVSSSATLKITWLLDADPGPE